MNNVFRFNESEIAVEEKDAAVPDVAWVQLHGNGGVDEVLHRLAANQQELVPSTDVRFGIQDLL